MHHHSQLFIGGEWAAPSGTESINAYSASTEEHIGSFPEATPADIDAAVSAARRALTSPEWAEISQTERAALMNRFADVLEAGKDDRGEHAKRYAHLDCQFCRRRRRGRVTALLCKTC